MSTDGCRRLVQDLRHALVSPNKCTKTPRTHVLFLNLTAFLSEIAFNLRAPVENAVHKAPPNVLSCGFPSSFFTTPAVTPPLLNHYPTLNDPESFAVGLGFDVLEAESNSLSLGLPGPWTCDIALLREILKTGGQTGTVQGFAEWARVGACSTTSH